MILGSEAFEVNQPNLMAFRHDLIMVYSTQSFLAPAWELGAPAQGGLSICRGGVALRSSDRFGRDSNMDRYCIEAESRSWKGSCLELRRVSKRASFPRRTNRGLCRPEAQARGKPRLFQHLRVPSQRTSLRCSHVLPCHCGPSPRPIFFDSSLLNPVAQLNKIKVLQQHG